MKNLIMGLLALSSVAQATSPVFETVKEPASTLHSLQITQVGNEGLVLRDRFQHPYTDFLLAIPVTISTGDACTGFVGQITGGNEKLVEVTAIGAKNPLHDTCIAVLPSPVSTTLTIQMRVLTGGFVPAGRIQKRTVQFNGVGMQEISLDLTNNTVSIKPVGRRPR